MTTLDFESVICANCKNDTEQTIVGSTNQFGSSDLDLRPAEMMRGTMSYWLQECSDCGYVAGDISKIDDATSALMKSEEFRNIQNDLAPKGLERMFIKRAFLDHEVENFEEAANNYLHAAWAADDIGNLDVASECRSKAASSFLIVIDLEPKNLEKVTVISTQLIDIYRRSVEWDKAIVIADDLLTGKLDDTIKAVVEFGKIQASAKNAECFTVKQALA